MHPVLLELGPVALPSYGLFAALALLVAVGWAAGREQRPGGIGEWHLVELAVWAVGAGLVAARLPLLRDDLPLAELVRSGGFFDAGAIGVLVAMALWARRARVSFLPLADRLVPAAPIAQAIGRLGCLAAGCCFGTPSTLPWAVVYRDPRAQASTLVPLGVGLHPAPIYFALLQLLILVVLWKLPPVAPGGRLAAWALLEGLVRMLLDGLRGDPRGELGPLPATFAIALLLALGGAGVLLAGRRAGGGAGRGPDPGPA